MGDPIIKKGKVGIPLTYLTLPQFCACPKTELGLQTLYVVVFFCVEWFEVVVRFVDINGIVLLTITI